MTKKSRRNLFIVCLILFLLVAPSLVLYSQGYRFDFETKRLSQTGGLFVKASPRQTEIYLNDELEKKTDFFFGSALIENLLPKKYKVEVRKEGYSPWHKTLEVKEREATEAKNIILFEEDMNPETLATKIERFWLSPDKKKIVLKEIGEIGWSLKLYESGKKLKSHLMEEKDIYLKEPDLLNLYFSEDLRKVYLEIGAQERIEYFSLNLEGGPPILTRADYPFPEPENTLAWTKNGDNLYYLTVFGYLFKDQESQVSDRFPVKPETNYTLKVLGSHIFLQEEETLYKLNVNSASFEKIFEPVKNFKLSPDSKKLLIFSDYEIWILFLEDELPIKKAGDKVFLMRLSEKIGNCLWLDSSYVVFTSGNRIKISEIDERDRVNMVETKEIKNPEIIWNENDKRLYILSEGNFSSLDFLF
ncbi:MAG: hypothetical protein Q8P08_01720 [bacterium]|nr:hypothetical protein [bacterium]